MKKNKVSSYILFVSIMTFIVIFFIVVLKSYDNLVSSLNIVQANPLIKSVNLELKYDVIQSIESRQ